MADDGVKQEPEAIDNHTRVTGAERWADDVEMWREHYLGICQACGAMRTECGDCENSGYPDGIPPRDSRVSFSEGTHILAAAVGDFDARGGAEHLPERSRRFLEELRNGLGAVLFEIEDRCDELSEDLQAVPDDLVPGPLEPSRSAENRRIVAGIRRGESRDEIFAAIEAERGEIPGLSEWLTTDQRDHIASRSEAITTKQKESARAYYAGANVSEDWPIGDAAADVAHRTGGPEALGGLVFLIEHARILEERARAQRSIGDELAPGDVACFAELRRLVAHIARACAVLEMISEQHGTNEPETESANAVLDAAE